MPTESPTLPWSIIEQAEKEEAIDKAAALKKYRALLERNDRPKRGGAEELRECLKVLGRTRADLKRDLGMLVEARRLRGVMAGEGQVIKDGGAARREVARLTTEYNDAASAFVVAAKAAGERLSTAQLRGEDIVRAKISLGTLVNEHCDIVDSSDEGRESLTRGWRMSAW